MAARGFLSSPFRRNFVEQMSRYWVPDQKAFLLRLYLSTGQCDSSRGSEGSARALWQLKIPANGYLGIWGIPSPDGRYLAIVDGIPNNNVWMLEGF
jgi:hypothetical protein